MRFTRIVTVLVAAFTAAMLGLTMAPSNAHASVGERAAAGTTPHVVKYKAKEIRNSGRFVVKGKATTYLGKKVKLQRANKGSKKYRTFKQDRTNKSTGKFKMTFDGPCGSKYRIVLKGDAVYANTKIKIGKIRCY